MIRYVDSKRNFQNMNKDKRFYPSNYAKEDIEKSFLKDILLWTILLG